MNCAIIVCLYSEWWNWNGIVDWLGYYSFLKEMHSGGSVGNKVMRLVWMWGAVRTLLSLHFLIRVQRANIISHTSVNICNRGDWWYYVTIVAFIYTWYTCCLVGMLVLNLFMKFVRRNISCSMPLERSYVFI